MNSNMSDADKNLISSGYTLLDGYAGWQKDVINLRSITINKLELYYTPEELNKLHTTYKILINNIGLELLKMINDILDDYTCWPLYINTGNDKFLKLFVNWLEKVKAMRG